MQANQSFGSMCQPILNNGYQPLPVNGKQVVVEAWTTRDINSQVVNSWSATYQNNNLGIRTGQGLNPVFGADFDFYEKAVVERVTQAFVSRFGEGLIRRGQAPKVLMLYVGMGQHSKITSQKWVDPNNPTKSNGNQLQQGFELLGTGQQFVAFGKHPETGLQYVWDDLSPADLAAVELTHIDPAEVADWVANELPKLMPAEYQCIGSANMGATSDSFEYAGMDAITDETLADIESALDYFTESDADNYEMWAGTVGHALKTIAAQGFEEHANALYHRFAKKSDKYEHDQTEERWQSFKPTRTSYKSILKQAQARGWTNPKSSEGRRQAQRDLNKRLGEGTLASSSNEILTLDEMLERFVYNTQGQYISDRNNPYMALKLSDARIAYAASRMKATISKPDGSAAVREVDCLDQWIKHPKRETTAERTFIAGDEQIVFNENNIVCFNTFRSFNRTKANKLLNDDQAEAFVEHIRWLFADRADDFLDWLAHIEKFPGVLPQTAWLHIASNMGLGRNWISSVLVRVWPGYVASNFDIVSNIKSSFNGELSHKLLAQVDELNEAQQGQNKYQFYEKLKSMLNPEYRRINHKYGMQMTEKNACRFLMFSNHDSAIPLQSGDRRVEVVICREKPKDDTYYERLYSLLRDVNFIASVAKYLGERDISKFNPGAHAKHTADKDVVVDNCKTEQDKIAQLIAEHWEYDLLPTNKLNEALKMSHQTMPGAAAHALKRAGIASYIRPGSTEPTAFRLGKKTCKVSMLRRHDYWLNASPEEIKTILAMSAELLDEVAKRTGDFSDQLTLSQALVEYLDDKNAL